MVRTFFALGGLMLCLGLFSCYDENGTYGSDLWTPLSVTFV